MKGILEKITLHFVCISTTAKSKSKHLDISDVNSKPSARFNSAIFYNLENMQTAVIQILNFQRQKFHMCLLMSNSQKCTVSPALKRYCKMITKIR